MMKFEIIGEIANVETIAQGNGIRDLALFTGMRPTASAK